MILKILKTFVKELNIVIAGLPLIRAKLDFEMLALFR